MRMNMNTISQREVRYAGASRVGGEEKETPYIFIYVVVEIKQASYATSMLSLCLLVLIVDGVRAEN